MAELYASQNFAFPPFFPVSRRHGTISRDGGNVNGGCRWEAKQPGACCDVVMARSRLLSVGPLGSLHEAGVLDADTPKHLAHRLRHGPDRSTHQSNPELKRDGGNKSGCRLRLRKTFRSDLAYSLVFTLLKERVRSDLNVLRTSFRRADS